MTAHCPMLDLPPGDPIIGFLDRQLSAFPGGADKPRPWQFNSLHNPWSPAAAIYDSWGFLDICQARTALDVVIPLLGPDIILFDSQLWPNPWGEPIRADAFPIAPPVDGKTAGASLLFVVAGSDPNAARLEFTPMPGKPMPEPIPLPQGRLIAIPNNLPFEVKMDAAGAPPRLFAARYFAASAQYIRNPAAPVHRCLTERYPLMNFAKMPLWLVCGEDRADNDFVTGFSSTAAHWSKAGR